VVASEVKALANQTARATEDIQRNINAIHKCQRIRSNNQNVKALPLSFSAERP
jgi:methyl-accepting chemotaxis protein